jgi:DNA-binding winged helix-turn-helix (wHTH) protein
MWHMDQRKPVLQFGQFQADLETGELYRDGLRVPLQQQPFRVLAILLMRPGELVSREELRRAIWADGTFVAFERGLTSAVRKVREALGDHAAAPAFIETLPGRGYRFIAPVTEFSRKTAAIANVSPAAGFSAFHSRWRAQAAVMVLMAVLEGGIGPGTYALERLAAAETLSDYACLLKAQGRFEEGLAAIAKAHAIAPEHARFTAELGLHLHAARRYEAELPTLLRAVEQDRGSVDAWLHLGLGYARRAQFDSAIPALERAVRVSNGDNRASSWLEWARHQRGGAGS